MIGSTGFSREKACKYYELKNHLGNVLVTVSDLKLGQDTVGFTDTANYYYASVLSAQDYYSFGWMMPERQVSAPQYRYGFQGQEKDDEWSGSGNAMAFKYRVHDARVGRFLSVDPLSKDYPGISNYVFSENRVINGIDLEGAEWLLVIIQNVSAYYSAQDFRRLQVEEPKNGTIQNLWTAGKGFAHNSLDMVGMVPVFGEVADGINGLMYTIEGNTTEAALSFGGMVPIAGWFSTGGKWAYKISKNADGVLRIGAALVDDVIAVGKKVSKCKCFEKETPIWVSSGKYLHPLEIKLFLSQFYNITDSLSNKVEFPNSGKRILIDCGSEGKWTTRSDDFVLTSSGWKKSSELIIRESIFDENGNLISIISIEPILNKGEAEVDIPEIGHFANWDKPWTWIDKPIPQTILNDEIKQVQRQINLKEPKLEARHDSENNGNLLDYEKEEITPTNWTWVELNFLTTDGDSATISLRRPNWWIREKDLATVGNSVFLDIPEFNLIGRATVIRHISNSFDSRFLDQNESLRPVTGIIQHYTNEIYSLHFESGDSLRVTGSHLFWSVAENDWKAVSDLEKQDLVKTDYGITRLIRKEPNVEKQKIAVYNFEVFRDHNFYVTGSKIWVHNWCFLDPVTTVVNKLKRDGAPSINLTVGTEKRGMKHILQRHSADEFLDHSKGDLFPKGTSREQISNAISQIYSKGKRVSDPKKSVQVFEKRIKLNGESAQYRLAIDNKNGDVITFFKIGE